MLELNKIHLGDCLDLMGEIPDGSVDMILCDLPYGITACAWDSVIPLNEYIVINDKPVGADEFLHYKRFKTLPEYHEAYDIFKENKKPGLWQHWKRVIKKRGAVVLTGTQPFTTELILSCRDWYKYNWYWKKERGTGFATSKKQPLKIIEDVCVFYKSGTGYNPQKKLLKNPYRHLLPINDSKSGAKSTLKTIKSGERVYKTFTHSYPTTLLEFARDNIRKSLHPTQKPVALFSYLVRTYSNEGDIVLDNCIGSGTTAISALETTRQFIGIEKDKEYHRIAVERAEKYKKEHKQLDLF